MANTYLAHYASKYYDPQKAHEYYEEHKKLTGYGRKLNEKGNAATTYVKKQIGDAQKAATERAKATIEDAKTKRETALSTAKTNSSEKVADLYNRLLSLPKSEMKTQGARIMREIKALREETAKERESINKEYINAVKSARENLAAQKEQLSKDLENELAAIKGDSELSEATGTKKTKEAATTGGGSSVMSAEQRKRIDDMAARMRKQLDKNKSS